MVAGAAVAVVVLVVVGLALDDDGRDRPAGSAPLAPPGAPTAGRCPPPGPAVVTRETGETLCGDAARRYIERHQREQERQARRMYGLTPAKDREARRILATDAALRGLLGDRPYRVTRIGPWTLEGGTEAIGVLAEIDLPSSLSATALLPFVCDRRDGSPGLGRSGVTMRDVTQLMVLVHFATKRVAEITPSSRPGAARPKVTPIPLPGATRCPPKRRG